MKINLKIIFWIEWNPNDTVLINVYIQTNVLQYIKEQGLT